MKLGYAVALSLIAGVGIGFGMEYDLHAQAKPPAYVITEIEISNPDAYNKEYAPGAQQLLKESGGKFLARAGALQTFDGTPPKRISIIAYENMEKAKASFTSPAYRDLRKTGEKYAKFRTFAVEGLAQ